MKKTVGNEVQVPPGGDRCGGSAVISAQVFWDWYTILVDDEDIP